MTEVEYFDGRRKRLPSFIGHLKIYFHLHEADFLDEEKKSYMPSSISEAGPSTSSSMKQKITSTKSKKIGRQVQVSYLKALQRLRSGLISLWDNPIKKARQAVIQGQVY